MKKRWFFLPCFFFLYPLFLFAQWSGDPAVNNAICTAANNQSAPAITSDGSGGAIIAWSDFRGGAGTSDIYAQRINSNGTVQWAANGVAISTVIRHQDTPAIISDGSGGAIITWHDERPGAVVYDIYAQRINAAGTVQWTANGVAICTAANSQRTPKITSDGSGGAIITWYDFRGGAAYDIYAQRINAAGTVQWAANGVAICTAADNQYSNDIVSDGSGGAIITWYDRRSGTNYDIYARLINNAGTVQWAADGAAICTAANDQQLPQLTSDGSGGAIITWYDLRGGATYDIYAQRINAAGTVQWAANGVVISAAANTQQKPTIVSDGSGGAIITWEDLRGGATYDVYAQRINSAGAVQWAANGVAVCTAANSQLVPGLISNGSGGAIITWQDLRGGATYDIYAQQIDAAGTVQWAANGVTVSTAANTQSVPKIASSTTVNAIIVWQDLRGGATTDIYTWGINTDGNPLPIELLSFEADINDQTQVELKWITATEMNNDYFIIEKTKNGVNYKEVIKVKAIGNSTITYYYQTTDNEPYEGLSYYRLRQVDVDGKESYSSLVSVDIKDKPFAFEIFPNPALNNSLLNVNIQSSKDKEVLLVIRDVLGKEYYSHVVSVNNNGHLISLQNIDNLSAGYYLIIASNDNRLFKKRLVISK